MFDIHAELQQQRARVRATASAVISWQKRHAVDHRRAQAATRACTMLQNQHLREHAHGMVASLREVWLAEGAQLSKLEWLAEMMMHDARMGAVCEVISSASWASMKRYMPIMDRARLLNELRAMTPPDAV